MKDEIIMVGGYGHVGQTICRELAALYPGKVFAAGRSLDRAEQFSRSTGGQVRPLQLNIKETADPAMLDRVKLVVMCLDQTDTTFVRACLETGTHYVDISANGSFLTQVEGLHAEAASGRSTAVLSVGLAPGLTNLLAHHARQQMDRTNTIDISIMLGLGDQHGKAAIEWTVDNLGTDFSVVRESSKTVAASFTDGQTTDFGTKLGHKKAFRFDFSDQHTLPRTLGVPTVSTRLCFDSAAVTGMMAWLRASGAFRLLKFGPVRDTFVSLFGKMRLGSELFAVKIDARGEKFGESALVECFLQGKNEASITAKVAATVANAVYRDSFSYGVYHIEQLFGLKQILHPIHQLVAFETRMNGF